MFRRIRSGRNLENLQFRAICSTFRRRMHRHERAEFLLLLHVCLRSVWFLCAFELPNAELRWVSIQSENEHGTGFHSPDLGHGM